MLKKYRKSAATLTTKQLMAITGGFTGMSFAPYCDEETPCPDICGTIPTATYGWECLSPTTCSRVRC